MATITVPIYDANRGFRTWHVSEIYTGPEGDGRYVPNVDDMVVDWDAGFFRVITVDLRTGLSRLKEWQLPNKSTGDQQEGILFGIDISAIGESYRAYIDNSVTPHTLSLDSRLRCYGTTASHVKVFRGTDISDSGEILSAMYDGNGSFISENIPLESLRVDGEANNAIKTPKVGYTLRELPDGEVVTAVVYDDVGSAISYSRLLVKNSAFIRSTEANQRYVEGVYLESPFLSKTDDRVLELPTNMPVEGVSVTGVVQYSDGSKVRLPANAGQFQLHGLDHFISSTSGQKIPLVLVYWLGENEYGYGSNVGGNGRFVSEIYEGMTMPFESAYSIKLYAYPRWVDNIRGYELDYYIGTLDRSTFKKVNMQTSLTSNSPAFQPLAFGEEQHLTFAVEMSKVDPTYPAYRHIQTLDIELKRPGSEAGDLWGVGFSHGQAPLFGEGLVADMSMVNANNWKLDLANHFTTQEEWLNHLYYATQPLRHVEKEAVAPAPNMFVVKTKTRSFEFPIERWANELTLGSNDLKQGESLIVEFIHRSSQNDLRLSMAALPVNLVNPS